MIRQAEITFEVLALAALVFLAIVGTAFSEVAFAFAILLVAVLVIVGHDRRRARAQR